MKPDARWTLEPLVLIGVGGAIALYARRWLAVRRELGASGASGWRLASFGAGMLAVLLALVSPIDRLSSQLFFMHMIQHVLILDIAPILVILGFTKVILRPATRRLMVFERRLGPLGHPFFAVALYIVGVWTWHLPPFYDFALQHPAAHVLEHETFLIAGTLYWWHLLSPIRSRMRLGGMGPPLYMATTKLGIGLLGIALAFAPATLYPFYAKQGGYWGLTPHDDQALGGMIMAIEQSLVMGVALAMIFIRMLVESEREEQRAERTL